MSEHSYDQAKVTVYAQTGTSGTFTTATGAVSSQSALEMALGVALTAASDLDDALTELHKRLNPVLTESLPAHQEVAPDSMPRPQGSAVTEQVYGMASRAASQRRVVVEILDRLEV